jgi:DNA-directed RNA polymerase subunit M
VKPIKIVEEQNHRKDVVILEKDVTLLPMTERECPKCAHKQAWYWLQQTRSADEPPTQFFRCTKCKTVWREYK